MTGTELLANLHAVTFAAEQKATGHVVTFGATLGKRTCVCELTIDDGAVANAQFVATQLSVTFDSLLRLLLKGDCP